MTDRDLERTLRATLTDRAGTVTSGPQWAGAEDQLALEPDLGPRRRRLLPVAAAVLVFAVAGGVIAFRHDSEPTNPPPVASTNQVPIPAGMQAVDALGVEIFVPTTFRIDPLCGPNLVRRPVAVLGAYCQVSTGTAVTFARTELDLRGTASTCRDRISLGDESSCISGSAGAKNSVRLGAWWPRHQVAIDVSTSDDALGLRIIRSAHAVPVDRHGCAAARDPIEPPGKHDPASIGGAPEVPDDRPARSMTVCWYIAHRLVASASLGSKDASTVVHAAAGAKWLFSATSACSAIDHSDAVVLEVRYRGGGSAEGILRLASCPGRSAQSAGSGFVAELARLAGMPLTLGYSPTR
jgi:hypothetical protein